MENKLGTQTQVAQEFAKATLAALSAGGEGQAASIIAGISRMAGTYYFRSFALEVEDLEPGQAVLSAIANERGTELVNITQAVLGQIGIALDGERIRAEMSETGSKHKPAMDFKTTQQLLDRAFAPIKVGYGLSDVDAGRAAAIATAALIRECRSVLDQDVAFAIALYGFVEGTKTAPYPSAE